MQINNCPPEFVIRRLISSSIDTINKELDIILDRFFISYFNDPQGTYNFHLPNLFKELKEKKINFDTEKITHIISASLDTYADHKLCSLNKRDNYDYQFLMKKLENFNADDNIKSKCVYNYLVIGAQRGNHWSIPSDRFKILNIKNEAFASPFNSYCINKKDCHYFSLFDVDKKFGSEGNFFECKMENYNNNWLINPPYVNNIIQKMVDFITPFLKTKPSKIKVYIVTPNWNDSNWHKDLEKLKPAIKINIDNMIYYDYFKNKRIRPKFTTTIWRF